MPIVEGISSGIETGKIIQKLKEVEKRPIVRLERRKQEINLENQALQGLQKIVKELQDSVRVLYGFDTRYEEKKLVSDPPGFVQGIPNKKAQLGDHKIDVKNLTNELTIKSRPVKLKEKIPAGSIVLNGKKKTFKGGTLKDFEEFLNKNYSDVLIARRVRMNPKEETLVIKSKREGKKGLFKIKDPDSLLKKLDIYDPDHKKKLEEEQPLEAIQREEFVPFLFDPVRVGIVKEGPANISQDRKSLVLGKQAARNLLTAPPHHENKKLKFLSLNVSSQLTPPPPKDTSPTRLDFGPTRSINIKGIHLDTYNASRMREKEEPLIKDSDYGIRINSKKDSQEISFKGKSRRQRIPITVDMNSIDFYTRETKVIFSDPAWVYEVRSAPKKEDSSKEGFVQEQADMFPNLLKPAQNAKINLDGIDIERDSNKGLNDIIDGVQLDLLKKTDQPIIVSISNDHEKIKKQIQTFIDTYNKLLRFSRENTTAKNLATKPGKFDKMAKLKGATGILITNLSVRSLVNGLKTRASNPYPSFRKPHIKILQTIGISTGEIGARWEDISQGYLQLNEKTLMKALIESPLAVKDFFGSDTNQDRKLDNGFAYIMHEFLRPYAQDYGRGILYSSIKSNKERVRQIDKKIVQIEEKADRYEDKLKRKFGAMESAIHKQKSISEELKNKLEFLPSKEE